jgi:hypothetical protein
LPVAKWPAVVPVTRHASRVPALGRVPFCSAPSRYWRATFPRGARHRGIPFSPPLGVGQGLRNSMAIATSRLADMSRPTNWRILHAQYLLLHVGRPADPGSISYKE